MFRKPSLKSLLPALGVSAILVGAFLAPAAASSVRSFLTAYGTGGCTLAGQSFVADFSGDGKADLAQVGGETCVAVSTGTAFGNLTPWQTLPFFGTKATLAGDVSGDGKADLVAVNAGNTFVMTSTGAAFGAPSAWSSTPFYGSIGTFLADVNVDGKADLVAVNAGATFVMLSNGTSFGPPQLWSSTAFYGTVTT